MEVLKHYDTISQKQLVLMLDMKPQSASEMIKKLERKALIERVKSEKDKRIYMINLTIKGRIEANKDKDFKTIIVESLTDEGKEEFDKLIKKVTADLETKVKRAPHNKRHNLERKL